MRNPDCARGSLLPGNIDLAVCSDQAVGQRVREIRETLGMTALAFVAHVYRETKQSYSQSQLSRIENGKQSVTLADVAVFAAVDPLQRGREILAFGMRQALPGGAIPGIAIESGTPVSSKSAARLRVAEAGQSYQASDVGVSPPSRGPRRQKRKRPK